jgi:hypothetical protein
MCWEGRRPSVVCIGHSTVPFQTENPMSQFYLADPKTALRLANDRHFEEIKRSEWKNARHLERANRAARAEASIKDELRAGSTQARPSWFSTLSWRTFFRTSRPVES